jgi:hypothetical protein
VSPDLKTPLYGCEIIFDPQRRRAARAAARSTTSRAW